MGLKKRGVFFLKTFFEKEKKFGNWVFQGFLA